jgi:hypothetical protein
MLIHPWDAALATAEWQDWLASTDRFGMLAVNNVDPSQAPIVLPATTRTSQPTGVRRRVDPTRTAGLPATTPLCNSYAGQRLSTTPRAKRRSFPPNSPTSNPRAATPTSASPRRDR